MKEGGGDTIGEVCLYDPSQGNEYVKFLRSHSESSRPSAESFPWHVRPAQALRQREPPGWRLTPCTHQLLLT